jgi:SAM-dependent methyltransferase
MEDSTQRFSDRVEHYIRSRPGYPDAVFGFLRDEIGLVPGWVVADIGSGTGISSEPLLKNGNVLFGMEPNGPMREAAQRLLSHYLHFHSVNGTAEVTGLADRSVDLIIAAQAFHWFDPPRARAEFVRILKPGGYVALIWNDRRQDSTPFLRAYEQLLQTFGTDYNQVRHENVDAGSIARFFAPAVCHARVFLNSQQFDYEGLESRLLSSSYTPAADDPKRALMLAELRRIFEQHRINGEVEFEYDTRVYWGRLV